MNKVINSYFEKLELYKIFDILKGYCSTISGKKLVDELLPSSDVLEVRKMLLETFEAINLSFRNSFPSFYDFFDINVDLKTLESGNSLNCKSLLNLANILENASSLKEYFNKEFLEKSDYPILSTYFDMLYTNKSISDKVLSCIIDENTIDDNSSKELSSIRKKKRNLEQDIRNKLNQMIHSSKYSKYIMENVVTIRNDRFVIPVKEEYRSQINGFVHDISNAGSTLFIEPTSVFEMNNSLNKLKLDEEIEIEKILRELSMLFVPYLEDLENDTKVLGKLDFIFAKAKYAKNINGTIPNISDNKKFNLKNARHPLIDRNKCVANDIYMDKDTSILLITGPNTGGKTVTLKTVGLLTLMACSGLAIPVSENSEIYVFDKIFADIGDDQSISDSVSTFSSHMINIVDIIKNATPNSLVLVDELGSGTDPIEGANLAISILDYLKNLGTTTIATTHYQELKRYALTTKGFKNASVEFDISKLAPTYRLLIGIPGKSNAFEISKKLGLSEKIIDRAKSMMKKEDISIEELLKSIYDDKALIENEKEKILENSSKIEELKNNLEKENKELEERRKEIIENAKIKAREILLDAKEEANEIIKNLSNISSKKEADNLRNKLNKSISDIKVLDNNNDNSSNNDSKENYINKEDVKKNLEVYIPNLNTSGIVVSNLSKDNTVQVQIGSMKMSLEISKLQKLTSSTSSTKSRKNNTNGSYTKISKTRTVKSEINVIGQNVEEATFVIDKFLDDATLAKLQTVRIVHGKGTGKLREGIHKFLRTNSHVKSFRLRNIWRRRNWCYSCQFEIMGTVLISLIFVEFCRMKLLGTDLRF